ncbi:MAG: RNA methyltransferase [Actinobacteria bacterium ATB1]|nr:RNA methyltransferase [Actinobacteria bacterium ATB1]
MRRPEPDGDVIAGRRPVAELLRARRRRAREVLTSDPDRLPPDLVAPCEELGVPIRWVGESVLTRMAGIQTHQGVVATADALPAATLGDLCDVSGFLVALDEVVDPRNLGAALRVADAMGAAGVVVSSRRSSPVTPTVVKASAGAIEWVPLVTVGNLAGALSELRDRGRWIIGLDTEGVHLESSNLLGEPLVLVAGAEGSGIRPKIRRLCDELLSVPMWGNVGSLNVVTALAIGAYVVSVRHNTDSSP